MDKNNETLYHKRRLSFTEVDMGILEWFASLSLLQALIVIFITSSGIGTLFHVLIRKPMDLRLKLKEKIENEKIKIEQSKLALEERRVILQETRMKIIEKAIDEKNNTALALLANNDDEHI